MESSFLYIKYRYSSHSFLSLALLRRNGAQRVWLLQKLRCAMVLKGLDPGVEKKTVSEGVKPIESLPRNFCGLVIHIKNTFCKKIGSKRSFQPSAVVRAIYPPPIWGHSRQLDDQHRNPNINNEDHHVGQLTRYPPSISGTKCGTVDPLVSKRPGKNSE